MLIVITTPSSCTFRRCMFNVFSMETWWGNQTENGEVLKNVEGNLFERNLCQIEKKKCGIRRLLLVTVLSFVRPILERALASIKLSFGILLCTVYLLIAAYSFIQAVALIFSIFSLVRQSVDIRAHLCVVVHNKSSREWHTLRMRTSQGTSLPPTLGRSSSRNCLQKL